MTRSAPTQFGPDQPSNRRAGFTLLEISLYVTLTGTLGAGYVTVLRGAYRAQQETTTMLHESAQLHRFAQDWTRDIHAAHQGEIVRNEAGSARLRLNLDGENRVEYWAARDVIRRVQHQNEELVHQDTYRIGDAMELEWLLDDSADFVEARLWRLTSSDGIRILRRQFVARLAANWRYSEEIP